MKNPATRRDFLTLAAATTAALASWKSLAGCGGGGGSPGGTVTRNLFFNFRHEPDADGATYHLVVGGKAHPIETIEMHRGVLDQERTSNKFLQSVPDDSITHVIRGLVHPGDAIQIAYVMKNRDPATGLWSMTGLHFIIPPDHVTAAHQFARQNGAPLEVSAKRMLYGQSAAQTEQDAVDEEVLIDPSDHAAALISFHPEMLSGHPASAAYIHKNLIQQKVKVDTHALAREIMLKGEAAPEVTAGAKNPKGWATLTPYRGDDNQPLRGKAGSNQGLILYNTEWHPDVQRKARTAIRNVLQKAKDDTSLGADITSLGASDRPALAGTIWHRRDGVTKVEHSGLEAPATSDSLVITPSTPFNGYSCDATIANGMVTLKLANWYLRWLGVWIEFVGPGGPIPVGQLTDPYFADPIVPNATAIFLDVLGPEWTIYGVPLEEATLNLTFPFPTGQATSARVIVSGLGIGPRTHTETIAVGAGLTVLLNLVAPTAVLVAGAGESLDLISKDFRAILKNRKFVAAGVKLFLGTGDQGFAKNLGTIFGKVLAGELAQEFVSEVVNAVVPYVIEDVAVDCIPIVGQILEAIGALGTLAELAETSAEVATSPWVYESVLVPMHDVTATIAPDTANGETTTPDGAKECVITALFDGGGTPRVMKKTLTAPSGAFDVMFAGVPLGRNITVSAGFYQGDPDDPHAILLGQATSGPVPNDENALPNPLVIKRLVHPINSTTSYRHVRKTILDEGGLHAWSPTTEPPTETADPASGSNLGQGEPGSLSDFRAITVRQASGTSPGYVGYAWQGFGTSCDGGSGDFDRVSNVNIGESAADGYATVQCGMQSGAKIAYSLLGQADANFYLAPDKNNKKVIRRVRLDTTPTGFDHPTTSTEAWGTLNFPSDALLLHPTGILVSVSNQHHRLETLKVPAAPLSDLEAATALLANVHGGRGTRPGLLDTPVTAAVSPDGVILVLEKVNNRIQAFDVGGNAVPFFKKQTEPYFLPLPATAGGDTVYLDMAVEHAGYIYVLSYKGGSSPYVYRLDIYGPDQSGTAPISTTQGFNAARIAVDFWRNVYGLNYEALKNSDGTVAALTEPSVSEWGPQG